MEYDRWRFANQLSAVYGLRPEELRHLRIKDGANGAELWSIYRKSMGGNKGMKTEPRRLPPALLRDMDGNVIDWNLQARIQIGEELPPLNRLGEGGQALGTYLRRKAAWEALRDEANHLGEQLTLIHSGTATPRECTRQKSQSSTSLRQWVTRSKFTCRAMRGSNQMRRLNWWQQ